MTFYFRLTIYFLSIGACIWGNRKMHAITIYNPLLTIIVLQQNLNFGVSTPRGPIRPLGVAQL